MGKSSRQLRDLSRFFGAWTAFRHLPLPWPPEKSWEWRHAIFEHVAMIVGLVEDHQFCLGRLDKQTLKTKDFEQLLLEWTCKRYTLWG